LRNELRQCAERLPRNQVAQTILEMLEARRKTLDPLQALRLGLIQQRVE
jgi:hypothetical protein